MGNTYDYLKNANRGEMLNGQEETQIKTFNKKVKRRHKKWTKHMWRQKGKKKKKETRRKDKRYGRVRKKEKNNFF